MSTRTRRKCRHCGQLFRPDPRNVRHQRYCSAPACRAREQGGESAALAGQSGQPRLLPRPRARGSGARLARPPIQGMPEKAPLGAGRYKNTHPRNLLICMSNQRSSVRPRYKTSSAPKPLSSRD